MSRRARRVINVLASVLVPLGVQLVWIVIFNASYPFGPKAIWYAIPTLGLLAGFSFLVWEFRWHSIVIGLAYMVLMWYLFLLSSAVIARFITRRPL